jgi:nucleotide-binding universal stress UspA family protein
MNENILIATDGSEEADRAVNYGIDLAEEFDARVHALYVVETEATYILTVSLSDNQMEEYKDYGEETVTGLVERAKDRGLEGTGVVKTGAVADEIVEYAEENDIETIVMGRQGRGSTLDKYIGGTAEQVMRTTNVPVITVGQDS